MAITQEQINQAIEAAEKLERDIFALRGFVGYVKNLSDGGWKFSVDYTNQTYPITQQDQDALLVKYTDLKNQLVVDFGQLP